MKIAFYRALLALAVWGVATAGTQAAVLMLDFGPTVATGGNLTNSPYHTANGSFTGASWNQVQTADVGSGLLWSDGTSATGLSLNIGATTAVTTSSSTLNLGSTPSGSSALGTITSAGVYAGTSVGTDGIFTSTSGNSRAVGFQLSGLAAGTYEVYVSSRNTSSNASYTPSIYAGNSATSGNFVIDGGGTYSSGTLSFANGAASTSSWVSGGNYVKLTVTLNSGDVLNLAALGGGGELRGFLNSVEVVAVPEPSSLALVGIGYATLVILRRKARR